MASPTFGAVGTDAFADNATPSCDVPDGVVADSLVVIHLHVGSTDVDVTAVPSGFTEAPDSPVVINPAQLGFHGDVHTYWKRATGTESTAGTYDFTLSAGVGHWSVAMRYDGVVTSGDPWDVTASAQSGTSDVTASPAVSDTTTVPDTLLVHVATNLSGGTEGSTWTPSTGFTARDETEFGLSLISDKAQAAAGATGSISATATTADKSGAWLGALKSTVGTPAMPRVQIVAG